MVTKGPRHRGGRDRLTERPLAGGTFVSSRCRRHVTSTPAEPDEGQGQRSGHVIINT